MIGSEQNDAGALAMRRSPEPTLPTPASLGAWVMASRPRTLPVAVAPVVVGGAVAYATSTVRVAPLVCAMLGALFIQIGTNFANDVFDFEKGADNATRIGPPRAVQSGLLTPSAVRRAMIVAFGLAVLAGLYLVAVAGWPIVAIGVLSIASGIAYTGGPYPLGYNGLGDVFVFAFFGVVAVTGTTLVASGAVPPLAWLASLPVGALATAVLVVNNVRDHATDVVANKRTLVVRLGRSFGVVEYACLVALAFAVPAALAVSRLTSPWVLVSFVTLPSAIRLTRTLAKTHDGTTLNQCLASTAKLMLAHSFLVALGIVLTRHT